MYVCICNAITDKQIRQAAAKGASSVMDLTDELGVASCCGSCFESAAEILAEHQPRGHRFEPVVFTPAVA